MGWFRRLWRGRQLDREVDAELRFHVDEEIARLTADGVTPAEARRRALAAFGGLEPIREQTRDARGTRWLHDLGRDLRYAARMMRRTPAFTLTAVLSLAVGIGANGAIFSVIDALLLRPLPIETPDDTFFLSRSGQDDFNLLFSYPMVEELSARVSEASFASLSGATRVQVTDGGRSELVIGQFVDGNWFPLLGLRAQTGRLLGAADNVAPGSHPVVVLSDGYWTRAFGRDPAVVGRALGVNGVSMVVAGIAPAGFQGIYVDTRVDVWVPMMMQSALRLQTGAASEGYADTSAPWPSQEYISWLRVMGRAAPGADHGQLAQRIDEAYRRKMSTMFEFLTDPAERAFRLREHVELLPGAQGLSTLREPFSQPLLILMTAVALVLLMACTNLASLLLARSSARAHEFALRLSIGAARSRIVRQLLTEALLLAALGGTAALVVATWSGQALLSLASPGSSPIPLDVRLDWRLLGFTAAVSLVTGLIFGLAPALRLSRADVSQPLRSADRLASPAPGRSRLPVARLLVAGQVALSLVLLVGSLLFLRTLDNLLARPVGFDRSDVLAVRFDARVGGLRADELQAVFDRLLERVETLPGVRSASLAYTGLSTGAAWISSISAEGRARTAGRDDSSREEIVSADYFTTVGMTLLRGRGFLPSDRDGAPPVAVVNEAFARHFFGDADPIGRRFGYSEDRLDREIVGVVADARIDGLRSEVPPQVFYPHTQYPQSFLSNLLVRVDGDPAALRTAVSRALAEVDTRLAVREIVPLDELTGRTVARDRLLSRLTSAFALIAVGVACLGLFGSVSYSVSRRTREIGVRLALGASPAGMRRMVMREVFLVVGGGCAAGLALSLLVLRAIEGVLFGLSADDPATLAGAAAILVGLGLLSGFGPAIRAARVDPVRALRGC